MEVDWAGATLNIHNPITGEISKAYLFVTVLPCSCFTYTEACEENWICCHVHAYNNCCEPDISGNGGVLRYRHRSRQSLSPSG